MTAPAIAWFSVAHGVSSAEAQSTLRDSAGIRIIENRATTAGTIRIADQPTLTIQLNARESRDDGAARTARLADGTILIVDRMGRWTSYNSAGRRTEIQTTLPGAYPRWIARFADDSVVAMFASPVMAYYADRSLRVVDSCRFEGIRPYGSDDPWPVLHDGAIVVQVRHGANGGSGDTPARDTVALKVVPRNCAAPQQLSIEPTGLAFTVAVPTQTVGGSQVFTLQAAFARHISVHTDGSNLFLGDGDRYEIRVMSRRGEALRLVRSLRDVRPVASADSQRFTRFRGTSLGDAMLAKAPTTIPFFARVEVDAIGRLWVQDFRVVEGRQEWTMFTADGVEAGRLFLPHNMTVVSFGAADVLTTEWTPAGIETIRTFPLIPR